MKVDRVALVVVSAAAVAALALGWLRLDASRASAADAQENLRRCRALAREIEALKSAPAQASLEMQSQQQLAMLLEEAAQAAGLPESAVASIHPEAQRRLGRTDYVEQPTRIEIRQLTLEQVVSFLVEVASRDSRIQPSSLRLTAPRGGQVEPEIWQAEVVLTHVVFSPESGRPQ